MQEEREKRKGEKRENALTSVGILGFSAEKERGKENSPIIAM